jgi:tetratricopeptide (TPR) repeat protein
VQRTHKEAALDALRRVDAMPIETREVRMQWRVEGDVRSAIGDVEGAIAAYTKVLESRDILLSEIADIAVLRIPVLCELARLEEASGRFADARRHYKAYLDRWGSADVDIPNVADGRTRLDALNKRL